ncbi:MAG TPA: acyl-CoA desaturase [Streptosporangiaceae bacterium]|nr:acyl-CoA desaturase [Streptosporangiaceae bacterium]
MLISVFVGIPFIAVIAAAIVLWDVGIGIGDLVVAVIMYILTATGIGVGYHRLFTHQAFKGIRPLRILLACLGTMAIEGDVISWSADHRRHHQFSDKPGDPHSPWRFGDDVYGLIKGMAWAHFWWIFRNETTNKTRYAPDLLSDPDIVTITRWQPVLVLASFGVPALIGGLAAWSWVGALTGLFWGGLVRVGLLHHVTWSVNSICHAFGDRPYRSRDRSGNVWWLAIPSGGEAWHNYHHADPTSARHGVLRMQIDTSARIIWLLEKAGWAYDVRWPDARRIRARLRYETLGAA